MSQDAVIKNTQETEVLAHPGLPKLASTGYLDTLWYPKKVAKIMDYFMEEHEAISMNRGSTMTWMQLRDQLPVEWRGLQISRTRPTSATLGVMKGKQRPHPAADDLLLNDQGDVMLALDPCECAFADLMQTPLTNFAEGKGEKVKRRIVFLRQRWEAFAAMLAKADGHAAPPMWQASRTRCAKCGLMVAMSRIGVLAKQKCRETSMVHGHLLGKWQEEVKGFLGWLHGPLELPRIVTDGVHDDLVRIRDGDVHGIYTWLGAPDDRPKGLVIGRLTAMMNKWQLVQLAWTLPAKHCLVFDSIDGRALSCLRCTSCLPPNAKLKGFLLQECVGSFSLVSGDVEVYASICLDVILTLQRAIEVIRNS